MAGVGFKVKTTAITLTASQTHTLAQLAAASNHRVKVPKINVSFNGITAVDPPILVEVIRQTTSGTMTPLTLVKDNSGDNETLQATASENASGTEPTGTEVLWGDYVHPQTGITIRPDKPFPVIGGERLGVRYTAGTLTATTKGVVTMDCEE